MDGFGFWQLASLMTRSRLFHFRGEDDLWAFWDLFQAAEDKAPAIVILEDLNRIFGGDGTAKCDHRFAAAHTFANFYRFNARPAVFLKQANNGD